MKIKMLIPMALVLCLAFSLCACSNTANASDPTTAPATTTAAATEAETTAPADTKAETETAAPDDTNAETEAEVEADFTEEDALELVQNSYDFSDEYLFYSNGIVDIEGTSYYAVDLKKSNDSNVTYISSFFVTLDGSEIHKGYIAGGVATISDKESTIEVTEENALKVVEAAYDFEENCFLKYRGVEEIDGTKYFAVDLIKSLEANTTYLSTYFVTETGEILLGYYAGDTAVIPE